MDSRDERELFNLLKRILKELQEIGDKMIEIDRKIKPLKIVTSEVEAYHEGIYENDVNISEEV